MRTIRSLPLALALLAVSAGAAASAQQDCTGLSVSPAREERDLVSRHEYQLVVRNCEDFALQVDVAVEELGHDLDGAPQFTPSRAVENAVRVRGDRSFVLLPGTSKTFDVRAAIPRGERSLYAGIVAEFAPVDAPPVPTVEIHSRVASMLLLRAPKPWVETADVVDVGLQPADDGRYTVFAAVKDTGNVHINPTGVVEIRQDGALLDRVRLTGATILPTCRSGCARRLVGSWKPSVKLAGSVQLTARISEPGARATRTVEFSEGRATTPAAEIRNLIARDRGGALVTFELGNTGNTDLRPVIELFVTEGEFERARTILTVEEPLRPGAERAFEWRPDVGDGAYLVTARAKQGERLLDEKIAGMRIGAPAPASVSTVDPPPAPRWPLFVLAGFLLLVVAGLLLGVVWWKRRRRDDDEQPPSAPAREPAQAAPR